MKARLLAITALILGMVSCQKDQAGLDVIVDGEQETTISVSLPEATRANSAHSGLQNVDLVNDYDIRYILEIYDGANRIKRIVNVENNSTSTAFDVRLIPGYPYTFVAWADFVEQGSVAYDVNGVEQDIDLYYNTDTEYGLKTVSVNGEWVAMTEARDAYTGKHDEASYSSASDITISLVRPFAKLRVITTDVEVLKNLGNVKTTNVSVDYRTEVYTGFDALNEKANTPVNLAAFDYNPYVYAEVTNTNLTLLADYLFGTESGTIQFDLTATFDNGKETSTNFNTDIPLYRNKVTTIKGNILTDGSNIKVDVNDDFDNPNSNDPNYEYETISSDKEFLAAINGDGGNYIVISDLGITSTPTTFALAATRSTGNTVNINLNGKTITIDDNVAITIPVDTTLTIKDESENGEGSIEIRDTDQDDTNDKDVFVNNGTINLEGGNLDEGVINNTANGNVTITNDNIDNNVVTGNTDNVTNYAEGLKEAFKVGGEYTLRADVTLNNSLTLKGGNTLTLNLDGKTITGTDNESKSYGMINIEPGAKLTIEDSESGKIKLTATQNRGWNAYSSVISNQRGEFVLNGGTIEHLGGTDMAYGIDNLTNTGAGDAKTTINGGVVKSPYRAVRLFLNSTKALDEVVVNGGTIEGGNKSIWIQNANAMVNPGKLVVTERANLMGDVMVSGANAPELAIELSVAAGALKNGSTVIPSKIPASYDIYIKNGYWVVEKGVEIVDNEVSICNAAGLKWLADQVNTGANYFAGKTVKLTADIDLKNEEWTPIGSAYADHGFMGNFDGNGYIIKNLAIKNITPDSDGYVYGGLFGVTEGVDTKNQNYIKDLVIENVDIDLDGDIVAAAIAYPYYTDIENVTVKGNVSIKGGDYTAGVLAYTRRCVDATNIAIAANAGSVIEGNQTVGGVISDIQMNGGLTAVYSNFKASGLTVKGNKCVGGISGIISEQTLNGATVKNVTIVCDDNRTGIVAGAVGGKSTLNNVSYENVTGATRVIGATYDTGNYIGQIVEYADVKAVVFSIENGVKAVSVAELNLNGMYWQGAMDWAAELGEGWALASMEELNAIYDLRCELNDVLEADNADNALFWEGDELYIKNGSVYYANYMSSTEVPAGETDANGNAYFNNRVFFKQFNDKGYSDVLYSAFDCINKYAPLRDNYFARGVYAL